MMVANMGHDQGQQVKQHFKALDACRGICALIVVLVHVSANGFFYDFPPVRHGGRAVSFFFVLSGFVITYAYMARLRDVRDIPDFMIRRFGRLYPLHIFTLGLLVALELAKLFLYRVAHVQAGQAPFSGSNSLESLGGNVLLLNGLGLFSDFTWNGPSWSISAEFYTYILFAAVVTVFQKQVVPVLTALGLIFAGLLLWADAISLKTIMGQGFLSCIFNFILGSLTYYVFLKTREHIKMPPWASGIALAAIAAAFFIEMPFEYLILPIIFAGSIFVLAFGTGTVATMLTSPVPQFLGRISYSIYLVHFVVLQIVVGAARVLQSKFHIHIFSSSGDNTMIDFPVKLANDMFAFAILAVVVALSTLTYKFIEEPARTYFNQIARKMTSKSVFKPAKEIR